MPVHDWSRVVAGTFHDFHAAWIVELRNALNGGVLPPDYYAMAEQIAGSLGPDVLTLRATSPGGSPAPGEPHEAAVAVPPPRARFVFKTERDLYTLKQRTLVIRHSSEDRVVALIETLSPGNKGSRHALRSFVEKAVGALARGLHLLLIDLHPPGPRDPRGIHGAIWAEIADETYTPPPDKPLTLASYTGGVVTTAYVEPVAVGDVLPDMALFLDSESHVNVPLEATYRAAWRGVPKRWRDVLEAPG
jgi:hypothetical protein